MIEWIIGIAAGIVIILVVHLFSKNYLYAGFTGAFICSFANFLHELHLNAYIIRPADAALWIPMLLFMVFAGSVPFAFLLGLPLFLHRRKKKRESRIESLR